MHVDGIFPGPISINTCKGKQTEIWREFAMTPVLPQTQGTLHASKWVDSKGHGYTGAKADAQEEGSSWWNLDLEDLREGKNLV